VTLTSASAPGRASARSPRRSEATAARCAAPEVGPFRVDDATTPELFDAGCLLSEEEVLAARTSCTTKTSRAGAVRSIGTFDGVHRVRVLEAATASGLRPAVLTFDPHPRTLFGQPVELLTTPSAGSSCSPTVGSRTCSCAFDPGLAGSRREFAEPILRAMGADVVAAGDGFRFEAAGPGDPRCSNVWSSTSAAYRSSTMSRRVTFVACSGR
jgi:hypothetical protein